MFIYIYISPYIYYMYYICSICNKRYMKINLFFKFLKDFFIRKRICGLIVAYKRQKQCIPTLIIFVFTLNVFFSPNKEGMECFAKLKTHLELWFLNVKPWSNALEFNLVCLFPVSKKGRKKALKVDWKDHKASPRPSGSLDKTLWWLMYKCI